MKKGHFVPGDLPFFLKCVFISSLVWSLLTCRISSVFLNHSVQTIHGNNGKETQWIETHAANVLLSKLALVAF